MQQLPEQGDNTEPYNLEDKDLVYGVYYPGVFDRLVMMPLSVVSHLIEMCQIINTAGTWGEVRERAKPSVYAELVSLKETDYDSSIIRLWKRRQAGEFRIDELGNVEEKNPPDEEPFDGSRLIDPGFYPPPPEHLMLKWLPEDIQNRFGEVQYDNYGASWLHIEADRTDEVVAALQCLGYTLERNDTLIHKAYCDGEEF